MVYNTLCTAKYGICFYKNKVQYKPIQTMKWGQFYFDKHNNIANK